MGPFLTALMLSAGAGTWIYTKMIRSTGGNTQSALTVAAISGGLLLAISYFIFKSIGL
jgi:hypothetical protein